MVHLAMELATLKRAAIKVLPRDKVDLGTAREVCISTCPETWSHTLWTLRVQQRLMASTGRHGIHDPRLHTCCGS